MPRVNRDLQRRMAARRERERRRPSGERRYRFATEPTLEPEEAELEQDGQIAEAEDPAAASRAARGSTTTAVSTRGGTRAPAKPYSAYKDDYAYVYGDLRRVAAVIGGLLVALIVLYLVLPLLVH